MPVAGRQAEQVHGWRHCRLRWRRPPGCSGSCWAGLGRATFVRLLRKADQVRRLGREGVAESLHPGSIHRAASGAQQCARRTAGGGTAGARAGVCAVALYCKHTGELIGRTASPGQGWPTSARVRASQVPAVLRFRFYKPISAC